jgi:uncharacterized phage protein (TIGR01671 family)
MREILFRGKRIDNGEWIEGFFFQIWERTYILWGTTNGAPNMIEVDPLTVGQFTGLTDKNGKKIFEGDIVECVSWNEFFSDGFGKPIEALRRKMEVAFHNGAFRMKESYPYGIEPTYWDLIFNGDIEVIGNIHDNPELLKEAK